MKNKKVVIAIAIVCVVIVAVGLFIVFDKADTKSDSVAVNSAQNNVASGSASDQAATQADSLALNEQNAPVTSAYTTLDSLNANPEKYAQTDKVYFFHASWCPICKGIDAEINANLEKLPSGITIVKTDFDTATALRKQFGVTTQYTFVHVDKNNQQVAKWSATSFDKMLAGISANQ